MSGSHTQDWSGAGDSSESPAAPCCLGPSSHTVAGLLAVSVAILRCKSHLVMRSLHVYSSFPLTPASGPGPLSPTLGFPWPEVRGEAAVY